MRNPSLASLGALLSLLSLVGVLFAMGSAWGDLTARVSQLEATERYLHGEIRLSQGAK